MKKAKSCLMNKGGFRACGHGQGFPIALDLRFEPLTEKLETFGREERKCLTNKDILFARRDVISRRVCLRGVLTGVPGLTGENHNSIINFKEPYYILWMRRECI